MPEQDARYIESSYHPKQKKRESSRRKWCIAKNTRNEMWRRHGSSFYFFDKGWSSANPSAPPPAPNALFEIWEGYEREVVERKPRERFLFQPKDWEQTSPWHLLSYMQARALDSTNRVDLLASFEREPTKIPSSSKLTKELLIPPWHADK